LKSIALLKFAEENSVVTATITLSSKRNSVLFSAYSIFRMCHNYHSKIAVCRGSSKFVDTKSVAQLQEFASQKSPRIDIVITGKDELNALGRLVDYFNHGLGI
jgi:phosphotransferase system HPr-like phosphotransfer protein